MAVVLTPIDPLDDEAFESDKHQIELDSESRAMRLVFLRGENVLAHMVLDSDDAYDLAQRILDAYDKLEGIK